MDDAKAHGYQMPHPRARLIGRDREIDVVLSLLGRADVALVTLTGPGGVGKTRLALHIAHAMDDRVADGVVVIDLAPITDPTLVLPAIARTVGVHDVAGRRLLDQIIDALATREVLLVLDNVEHVLAAAVEVAKLLDLCPALTILATSRERLHLGGEHEYPLAPLSIPDDAQWLSLDDLAEFTAIQLFVQRAQTVQPDFALTPGNAVAVADICRRLEGLPLAIELAAARIRVLPPAAMQARLEPRLPLLAGGIRDHPARQQTMARTIAWSYGLLAPDEQQFFRTMAVFAGGFTLAAAEAVHTALGGSEADALNGITSLMDKSLLRPNHGADAEPRYTMLETIREFGLGQLKSSDEEAAVRHAHADWCLAYAHTTVPAFGSVADLPTIDRLEAEHANIRAAMTWLEIADRAADLKQIAVDLRWFWYLGGHEREGLEWLKQAVALGQDETDWVYREAVLGAGQMAQRLHDPEAAAYLELLLTLAQASGNLDHEASATQMLGIMAEDAGNYADAGTLLTSARALHEQLVEPWKVSLVDYHLGIVAYGQGDIDHAVHLLQTARSTAQAVGDKLVPAWCLPYLALIACTQERLGDAASLLRQLQRPDELSTTPNLHHHHQPIAVATTAVLAASLGEWASTARLLGVAATDYRAATIAMPEQAAFTKIEAEARRQLGEAVYVQAWEVGRDMHQQDVDADIDRVLTIAETTPSPRSGGQDPSLLTPREQEVLQLLVEGRSNRQIAETLFISHRTATTHVGNILSKFGVDSRAAAVTYAFQHQLA